MSQTSKTYQYDRNDNNTFGVRGKADEGTVVKANEALAGTEDSLTELTIGTTKYKVDQPINVVANPTLAGTEASLTGLEVGDTKYKVDVPHTINTYTIGTLTGDDITKIENDIANRYPIKVNNYVYYIFGQAEYNVTFISYKDVLPYNYISNLNVLALNYNFSNHNLSVSTTASTMPINDEKYNYSATSGSLLTQITSGGQPKVFGAMSTYALTTAPIAANTDGGIRFVVLSSEPATYYNGYYYIIAPTT